MRRWTSSLAVAALLGAVACGGGAGGQPAAGSQAGAASAAAAAATIRVAGSGLGQIVVDGSGRTLYLFQADSGGTSTCYGSCAQLWPPVLTHGSPLAGTGAEMALLGTTTRKDGSSQVTYDGHPLYYWVGDKGAGQTSGQGLNNSGGLWYVVAPDGTPVTKAA